MKDNKAITMVALIIILVIIAMLLGIVLNIGNRTYQKSVAGRLVTCMELVESRANSVYEEKSFGLSDKSELSSDEIIDKIEDEQALTEESSEMIYIKWEPEMLAQNGIDKNVLENKQYFIIEYNFNDREVKEVYYSKGCKIGTQRYYSLSDLKKNIGK